jgi:hypothetical protein
MADNNNNVYELRPGASLPNSQEELVDRISNMKSSYLELIAVNILETVIQQANAVGLYPDTEDDDKGLYDVAMVKESIMAMLARAAGCRHKLHDFSEKHFNVVIDDDTQTIHTTMIEPSENIVDPT